MSTVLALDTALEACSAALWQDGRILAFQEVPMQRGHSEALAPMVKALMGKARIEFNGLSRIAVTVGPGTFTGIRIALSFARALGLGLKIPVIGFSTLEAMAMRAEKHNFDRLNIFAVIDARRNEAYVQKFNAMGQALTEPTILSIPEIMNSLSEEPIQWIGSAGQLLARSQDKLGLPPYPDVRLIAAAAPDCDYGGYFPHPLYLRSSDAKPRLILKGGYQIENINSLHSNLLAELHAKCFESPWNSESFSAILSNSVTGGRLAVTSNGVPEAFVLINRVMDEAEIITLGVIPEARRKGLARMLLARYAEELGSLGVTRIFLEVSEGNLAARELYKASGFRETGRRKAYYRNGEDALLLARAC